MQVPIVTLVQVSWRRHAWRRVGKYTESFLKPSHNRSYETIRASLPRLEHPSRTLSPAPVEGEKPTGKVKKEPEPRSSTGNLPVIDSQTKSSPPCTRQVAAMYRSLRAPPLNAQSRSHRERLEWLKSLKEDSSCFQADSVRSRKSWR
jgi:hypothetical protein